MQATWIWYPGDFEVWLGNKFNNRRTERGAFFPPFWKQDSHWPTVVFTKTVELEEEEDITICTEGQYNLSVDGKLQTTSVIPKGKHVLALKVWNQATPPALFIDGHTIKTDGSWLVTYEDKIWIDECGIAHGSGIYVPVASGLATGVSPSQFSLPTKPLRPVHRETIGTDGSTGTLYDFGRETFGFLRVKNLRGTIRIYYGESREEATDTDHCETLDVLTTTVCRDMTAGSKAFRFVLVVEAGPTSYDDVTMDYEYAPFDTAMSGSFRCSDEELNKIWDVSAYTLELTTREFFCDGIKRDRWVWSGDAIQSYLMNYYLHFDTECVKRTIRQLRGKDPVTAHVNTIMDYTFYWFKSIADYYAYTGDADFIREMWPKMVSLMDYALGRTNADGMAEGMPDDWIFVDWVDFPMHKRGTLAFEQILFWKSLKTMQACASLLHLSDDAERYHRLAERLHANTKDLFFNNGLGAYLHAIEAKCLNDQVTKFPNMFAIIYDFASSDEKPLIADNVLQNPEVPPITTPYMRFYELEALCLTGHHTDVLREMKAYWGGMLREGASTFWEKYNPEEQGTEHLAMYGRPYGKSLCHAWGASPLYILGRYFLGIRPTKPGYEEYEVCPVLGGLDWFQGEVPTPFGLIRVRMDAHAIVVSSDGGKGTLIIGNQHIAIPANKEITANY